LVKDGQAQAVLVVPPDSDTMRLQSIASFQKILERSTGTRLPEVSTLQEAAQYEGRIVFGPSAITEGLGFGDVTLQPEEFKLKTSNGDLIILAEDRVLGSDKPMNIWTDIRSEEARVTQWALGYLLDRHLGVRFLWPGELGTVVPPHENSSLPEMDVTWQQPLVRRSFNVIEANDANIEWLNYHQFAGKRTDYRFRHSFRKGADNGPWQKTHPHLLAKNPEGIPSVYRNKPAFFKLCLTEPETSSEIVRLWREAGAPDFWDVTPNDGNGFCTCDNCRAIDKEYGNLELSKENIWKRNGDAQFTERYVWFWNQLLEKMRSVNADVQVGIYLYGATRDAPVHQKLHPGVVGEMVSGWDFSRWKQWQAAGIDGVGLRPNWLYMSAAGPHLPLNQAGDYLAKARDNGMLTISLDCFHEYWADQGPYYYLLTRMVARPEMTKDEVIAEYVAAFGAAAPAMREYLNYWSDYSKEVAWNIPAGGKLSQDPNGMYEKLSLEKFGEVMHPLQGHWKMMPHIYTPKKLSDADAILVKGQSMTDDPDTIERLEYFRDGLRLVVQINAYLRSGIKPYPDDKLQELKIFHQKMKAKYDYWNSKDLFFLAYWGMSGKDVDVVGM